MILFTLLVMEWSIYKDVLESIMEFSKSFYPNEFSGILFCDINNQIIEDIYYLPGTVSSNNSAYLRLDFAPLSLRLVGSVHSHPAGSGGASRADINFFSTKQINIIAFYPFNLDCYKVYDKQGKITTLNLINRKNPEK